MSDAVNQGPDQERTSLAGSGLEEMDCPELVELVTDYIEDAMPSELRARFEEHLKICPGCFVFLEQIKQTARILGKLPCEPPPPDIKAGLMAAFRKLKAGV